MRLCFKRDDGCDRRWTPSTWRRLSRHASATTCLWRAFGLRQSFTAIRNPGEAEIRELSESSRSCHPIYVCLFEGEAFKSKAFEVSWRRLDRPRLKTPAQANETKMVTARTGICYVFFGLRRNFPLAQC